MDVPMPLMHGVPLRVLLMPGCTLLLMDVPLMKYHL